MTAPTISPPRSLAGTVTAICVVVAHVITAFIVVGSIR